MKSKNKILIFLGLLAVIFAIAVETNSKLITHTINAKLCAQKNGKWAHSGNYCIPRDCIKDESCLPSYRNRAVCKTLELGIDKAELFFHLGMPIKIDDNTYIFVGGGADKPVSVILENDKLIKVDCDPP